MSEDLFSLAYDDLTNFCIITDRRYSPNWHHEITNLELEKLEKRVMSKEKNKLLILIFSEPPRHGKSERCSIKFPAWFLGRNPDKEIIVSSYSADLATDFGGATRTLVASPEYSQIFKTKLKEDEKSKGRWKTDSGGAYTSVGVGGALTGRGANILLIDDPIKNREEAESLVVREKVWNWFTSTAFTRLEPNGAVILVMTRWNVDDLAGRILDKLSNDDRVEIKHLCFPAIAEQDEEFRLRGEPLWQNKYDIEALNTIRGVVGERDWQALYQQDPVKSTGQVFKKEDFRYFNLSDLKKEEFTVAIHIDPAFSTNKESDDVGIVVTGRHNPTNNIYVMDCFGAPLLTSESYSYILSLAEKWKSWTLEFISIEEATISKEQQDFLNGFEKYAREQKKFYTTLLFKPRGRGKKEDRIKFSLEPRLNRHSIFFRGDDVSEDFIKLEEQLLKFPTNRRDDIIDALSQGVIMWDNRLITDDTDTCEQASEEYTRNILMELEDKRGGFYRRRYKK